VARRGPRSIDPELPHWRSHFATCAHAAAHRRRAKPRTVVQRTENTLPL
jgi:hypothetical protein